MSLNSINGLGTIDHIKDHIAFWFQKTNFDALDPTSQQFFNDVLEMAIVRAGGEAAWKPLQREDTLSSGFLNNKSTLSGTDGVTTQGGLTVTSAASAFGVDGVAEHDIYHDGTVEVGYRIDSGTGTTLTLKSAYANASATSVAFTVARDSFILANGVWWLRSVQDMTDGRMIPLISEEDFLSETAGLFQVGTPRVCMLTRADASDVASPDVASTNQLLRFWPVPDSIRKYRYRYMSLPDITKVASEFQPHLQSMVIHAALTDIWQQRDEPEKSQFHEAKYRAYVQLFQKRDVNRSHQNNLRMQRQFVPGQRSGGYYSVGRDPIVEP